MCRSIRTLRPPYTDDVHADDVHAAALQYVRKIAGTARPAQVNEAVFALAVQQVAAATRDLLDGLVTTAPPKDRETEAAKAKARSAARFG